MTEVSQCHLEEINARLARLEACLQRNAHAVTDRNCQHKQQLKATLLEIISVLDSTRKAFHSRQLEMLRGKLTKDLAELAYFQCPTVRR